MAITEHDDIFPTDERLIVAQVAKLEAEAAKLLAEAEAARTSGAAEELTADEYHKTYLFNQDVSESSVTKCVRQLSHWERTSDEPLTVDLQINSPGGSIFDGFALVDYIAGMHARGHVVNTSAFGMAASMGGVLLQVGVERRMGASAMVLIHEASFGSSGSMGKIEDQVELAHLLQNRILDMYAERAKNSGASSPMSRAQIKRRWQRKDWWLTAVDCKKYGFIDRIV
jgi:ATP-dependent Clp protease, protease subunit